MVSRLTEIREDNVALYIEEKGEEPDEEELFLDQVYRYTFSTNAYIQMPIFIQTQQEFEELSNLINNIITNTKAIIKLENRAHSETTQSQHKDIMTSLDALITSTMTNAKAVSSKIKIYRQKNQEYAKSNPHSTLSQWRINKLNASTLRFQV